MRREPTVGFQFTPTQIVVTEAIQREKLGQCEDVNGERLKALRTYVHTPELVKAYSSTGNSIHYDMASAKQRRFSSAH